MGLGSFRIWKEGNQVAQIQEDLSHRIQSFEKELEAALDEKERAFRYRWEQGEAKFEEEVLSQHRKLKLWLPSYIRQSRFLAVVTAPIIYQLWNPVHPASHQTGRPAPNS